MVSTLRVLLLLALTAPAGEGSRIHVTFFGESLLSRCDLVVRCTVVRRSVLSSGVTLTSVRVEETLLGVAPGKRLALTSSDPSYHGEAGHAMVYFLSRSERDRRPVTVERFRVSGVDGEARLRTARAYIRIEADSKPERRIASIRALHLSNLSGGDDWMRANAIRELSWFTRRWAETFTREERGRVDSIRKSLPESALRTMLADSLRRIDAARRPAPSRPRPPVAPDREKDYGKGLEAVRGAKSPHARAAALDLLARTRPARVRTDLVPFLGDEAPEVRRVAAYHLGETEHTAAGAALFAVLRRPREDPMVRRDVIRSLGILRHADAVEAIAVRFAGEKVRPSDLAVLAIARIGTPEAKRLLTSWRQRRTGDQNQDATLGRILAFVAGEGFRKQEKILARVRRKRLEADR